MDATTRNPDLDKRIANFENMAQADPENEMAHFSLGRAYAEAGRYADAAESLLRCIALAPQMSKAYQLAGESLIKTGSTARAAEVLEQGYLAAAQRGDLMPKNAIADLLTQLGRPLPKAPTPAPAAPKGDVSLIGAAGSPGAPGPAPDGAFVCRRTGRPGIRMAKPPFRGPVGEWIAQNIAKETWQTWIGQGTKVINELRLDLSREQDAETYDQHMREYLGIDDALYEQLLARK